MKKNLLFVPLMALSLLSGCSTGNGKTVLKIGFWPLETDAEDVKMYTEWKNAFEADYPEYQIVADHYEYSKDTIAAKARSGELPTVFETWFTEPATLRSNRFIRSIDKQIKELHWDEKMDAEMKKTLTFDGEIYGIPRAGYGLGLVVNLATLYDNGVIEKDESGKYILYDEEGKPLYPTTFDAIKQVGLEIAESSETKAIYICSTNKNGGWQFSNYAWNFGAELTKEVNGRIVANLDCDEAVQALEWIRDLKNEDLLLNQKSCEYEGWYNKLSNQVAMAVVGNDVVQNATTQAKINKDDIAFLPMPSLEGKQRYSLYGGTPYVFASNATDAQVEGVLKFFDYIGRSPNINDVSKEAMRKGYEVAKKKNQPILPEIYPWKNTEFVTYKESLFNEYVSVNMDYFNEFFDNIEENKHSEVPYEPQEMYTILDDAIIQVLDRPETANCKAILSSCNSRYQTVLDQKVNK